MSLNVYVHDTQACLSGSTLRHDIERGRPAPHVPLFAVPAHPILTFDSVRTRHNRHGHRRFPLLFRSLRQFVPPHRRLKDA